MRTCRPSSQENFLNFGFGFCAELFLNLPVSVQRWAGKIPSMTADFPNFLAKLSSLSGSAERFSDGGSWSFPQWGCHSCQWENNTNPASWFVRRVKQGVELSYRRRSGVLNLYTVCCYLQLIGVSFLKVFFVHDLIKLFVCENAIQFHG